MGHRELVDKTHFLARMRLTSRAVTRGAIPFQITVHDGEEHLQEQVDGIDQHRQKEQPRFARHHAGGLWVLREVESRKREAAGEELELLVVASVVTSSELWRKLDKVGAACRREGELLGISGGFVIKLVPGTEKLLRAVGAHRSKVRERGKSNAASTGRKDARWPQASRANDAIQWWRGREDAGLWAAWRETKNLVVTDLNWN